MSNTKQGGIPMRRSILVITAMLGLAGFGADFIAHAQTQPAPGMPVAPAPGTSAQPAPGMPMMQGAPPQMQQMHRQMMQGGAAPAAQAPGTSNPHDHSAATPGAASAGTLGIQAANERMHRDMAITFTGNADRDFAASMIPHHQGAIDMARVVLAHGADPALRELAQGVIRDQEREIVQLRGILTRLPER